MTNNHARSDAALLRIQRMIRCIVSALPRISLRRLVKADLYDRIMVGIEPATGFPNCSVIMFCIVFVGAQHGMIPSSDVKKGARAPFVEKQRERYQ